MSKNLPVKSRSRGIQRAHRRLINNRLVEVNPDVKKKELIKASKSRFPVKIRPGVSRSVVQTSPKTGTPAVRGVGLDKKRGFLPKIRWSDVLSVDKGDSELIAKEREEKKKKKILTQLRPGEVLADKIELVHPQGFSASGGIRYLNAETGRWEKSFMEYRMSGAGLIEYLQEMQKLGKPVILNFEAFRGLTMLNGVREAEVLDEILPSSSIPYNEGGYFITTDAYGVKVTGDGMQRRFDSKETFRILEEYNAKRGLDVFGDRVTPQKFLKEYEKQPGIKIVEKGFSDNPALKEFQIVKEGPVYMVNFTSSDDLIVRPLNVTFSDLNKAKKYVKLVEKDKKIQDTIEDIERGFF